MGGSFLDINYLTLIAGLVNLILGGAVLRSNKKQPLNRDFFYFTFCIFIWCGTIFLFQEFYQSLFLLKSEYATGGAVLVTAFPWILRFSKYELKKSTNIILACFGLLIFFIPFIDGLLIGGITKVAGTGYSFTQGPLFNIFGVILFALIVTLIFLIGLAAKKAINEEKAQLKTVLVGILFFAAATLTVNVILPVLNINTVVPFDAQSSLIWVGLTTYAITRHGLFNIKVLATQSFIILLLALILSRVFSARSAGDALFELTVFTFTGVIGYFLSKSVQGEVSRREEIEKLAGEKTEALTELEQRNKNLRALQKISDIVLNENDMKAMTQKILDELPKQLDHCIGGFLSVVRKGELTAYALTTNNFNDKIFQAIGPNLEKYSFPIKAGFNRLHDTLIEKKSCDSDSLADFITPPIAKPVALTLQKIMGARHMEAFPLYAGGTPFGVLLFVFSANRDQIHGKNFEIAKSVADEMSLAVQRAEAFQQLKDANEYLAQLDKMKDEFISMASHELNTPLAAIEGYLSMILDEHMGGKIDNKTKEYLSRAYASSKRLAELVLDLLNVSRVEQGRLKMKFSQVNLVDLAESVVHELQIKADSKKIYLKVEADKAAVPVTWCDPDRIREVFVNLAGNALKFTEKGGVTIRIVKGEGDRIISSVTDTGRGIAKDDQKKLFQKFSQIHREVDEHQGTGLGLYISKNFVELHKGHLTVESEAGKGATFSFELPIIKEAPKEVEGAILDGPISQPAVVASTGKEVPAIITASSKVS